MNLNNLISDFELQAKAVSVFIWVPPDFVVSLLFPIPVNLTIECCYQESITEPILFIFTSQYFQDIFISSLNTSVFHKLNYLQITCQTVHYFCYLRFLSSLSTSQLACSKLRYAVLFSVVRHMYLIFCHSLSYFPIFLICTFPVLSPTFPFHFPESSLHTMFGDFCICFSLCSDSIPLLTHWFCPLAYPKLVPLKCILPCPL